MHEHYVIDNNIFRVKKRISCIVQPTTRSMLDVYELPPTSQIRVLSGTLVLLADLSPRSPTLNDSSIIRTGEMFFRHDICTALLTQVFEGESGSGTSETWYHWKAHEME